MTDFSPDNPLPFFCIGISHISANAQQRGRFALSTGAQITLLKAAKAQGFKNLFVLATCNRTEIYGFAASADELIELLCQHVQGRAPDFRRGGYVHHDQDAFQHLFRVGVGLESQILGDSQIATQLKRSFVLAKKYGNNSVFLDRLAAITVQTGKRVKSETGLSRGITSAASAAATYIREHIDFSAPKNILLFGAGTMGKTACESLLKQVPNAALTLINRSQDKAERLGRKYGITVKDISLLKPEIESADILIVATGSQRPTITKDMLAANKPRLIIDLSMPRNVATDIAELSGTTLIHLDALMHIINQGLQNRRVHIAQAESIVREMQQEFQTWREGRKYVPALKVLRAKLRGDEPKIKQLSARFAVYLKSNAVSADESLQLTSDVFRLEGMLDDHAA